MSRQEAVEQYESALKAGQKYYKSALAAGESPYPPVLDELIDEKNISGRVDLGTINIPSELIIGTKSDGRSSALAGNFMPLLPAASEFATKWINLCADHLGDEGIRDAVLCSEYMGKFYVAEGNKRVSVLKSFGSPNISAHVIREIPVYSDDPEVKAYYEFMDFYRLSRLYSVSFRQSGKYKELQSLLGHEAEHIWTEDERRSFSAGFTHLKNALLKLDIAPSKVNPSEVLLTWLQLFPFAELKRLSLDELCKKLRPILPDAINLQGNNTISVSTEPSEIEKSIISKVFSKAEHINVAFIYAFDMEKSVWTSSHLQGQYYLEKNLGEKVSVRAYFALDHDYDAALNQAVNEGAELIFATTPPMIKACRKVAAEHPGLRVLNCSPTLPYTGIRAYYSRIHESKFIAGAIAGAMAEEDLIGYIASYPIVGVPAGVNAFALGAKLTNPRAKIKLVWSCVPGDPLCELISQGITVISNKDATAPENAHWAMEWGTYKLQSDGSMLPLAMPCWDWGKFYVKVVENIFSGGWNNIKSAPAHRAVNYWWGMNSGVIDIALSKTMPEGTGKLARMLKEGIINGSLNPFEREIYDQHGNQRNDGMQSLSPEEIINMDWFCDNVDGNLPEPGLIHERHREMLEIIGLYRHKPQESGEILQR